jgi:hypothetical protein
LRQTSGDSAGSGTAAGFSSFQTQAIDDSLFSLNVPLYLHISWLISIFLCTIAVQYIGW